jgi:(p)ppGpp synthase/HD superfamily hydrolase
VAGKIDRRLAPLRTELMNGQTVEIISAPGARPNPVWLDFVVSAKARSNIRHFLKQLKHGEAVDLGRRMLDKALASFSTNLDNIAKDRIEEVLRALKLKSLDDLLEQISLGNRVPMLMARHLVEGMQKSEFEHSKSSAFREVLSRYTPGWIMKSPGRDNERPLAIRGTEGTVVTYAKCCRPIPGDPILGYISAGRGIVIHVQNCKNTKDYENRPDKWIDVQWEQDVKGVFPVDIRVDTANRKGVLATVAAVIADQSANIENVNIDDRDGRFSSMKFTISVQGRKHLASIIRQVRTIDSVVKIARSK